MCFDTRCTMPSFGRVDGSISKIIPSRNLLRSSAEKGRALTEPQVSFSGKCPVLWSAYLRRAVLH